MNLDAQLVAEAGRVEEALAGRFRDPGPAPRLTAAMRYSLMGGGKRLRPVLVLWVSDACGAERGDAVWSAACAIEMLHTYSLVHDDLPAMDDDDLRRGRASCHREFDEATAILAGDTLQTEAFATLSAVQPATLAAALVGELAGASGRQGMAAGQQLDLDGLEADEDALLEVHRLKTGALLSASLAMGGLCGELDAPSVERLRRAGVELGLAFQFVDDVLDVTATAATLGKSVGKDREQAKCTAVRLWGVDGAQNRARQLLGSAESALREVGVLDEKVGGLVRRLVERDR